jgi:xanthine dehydrogenase YagS FAD-binding subunit
MRQFVLLQPKSLAQAVDTLRDKGLDARPLGGGTDLVMGVMRDQVMGAGMPFPEELVDLMGIPELSGVRLEGTDCVIGASTTLVEVVENDDVARHWPLLVDAAASVATPEIRAVGTVGGNIHQRPRCWFFRNKDFDCIKKGGDICYAVKGDNRYNAIIGGHVCYIVHPSDLATALVALNASARVVSSEEERTIAFDDYFVDTRENLLQETVLTPEEILKEIVLTAPASGTSYAWEKLNDKGLPTWDFALVSAAVVAQIEDGVWRDGRIVLGGVAPFPYRATIVEEALVGRNVEEAIAAAAAEIRKVARPMSHNDYKVELAEVIIERAVRKAADVDVVSRGISSVGEDA